MEHMNAFIKFEARAYFVKRLAEDLQIRTGAFGSLMFEDPAGEKAFFKQLEAYDQRVKDKERDEYEASQDAGQGFQALTDDE